MKTFKHKNNGSTMTYKDGCMKIENLVIEGEPNLDYWEELFSPCVYHLPIESKEWEILSFINDRGVVLYFEGERCVRKSDGTSVVLIKDKTTVIQDGFSNIYSVKRLLDGEVFTLGDMCYPSDCVKNKCQVTKIFLSVSERLRVESVNYSVEVSELTKVKTPLLTTHDGVDIFEGTSLFAVSQHFAILFGFVDYTTDLRGLKIFAKQENAEEYVRKANSYTTVEGDLIKEGQVFYVYNNVKFKCEETSYGHFKNEKYDGRRFKTKEEVDQIVLMSKPCLSLKDLLSVWGTYHPVEVYEKSPLFNNFKKLADEKIRRTT